MRLLSNCLLGKMGAYRRYKTDEGNGLTGKRDCLESRVSLLQKDIG
jgi:hypothetical protein